LSEKDKVSSEALENLKRVCVERDEAVRKMTELQFSLATLKETLKARDRKVST
jgi:hypothetical protein